MCRISRQGAQNRDARTKLGDRTILHMEIVLIRHGQPEWIKDDRNVVDPPLTELGHRQAEQMALALKDERFDEVFVSPLLRARQTAAPLYSALGRDEVIDEWLREIQEPDWHGTPAEVSKLAYEQVEERPVEDRWHGVDGGESFADFAARIDAGLQNFLGERGGRRMEHALPVWHLEHPDWHVALVAHAGTNTITLGTLLGIPPTPWEWDRFTLGHSSITRLVSKPVHGGHTFMMTEMSNLEHLARDERTR